MTKIQVQNLSKRINKNVILDDISFSMDSGKIYGLQGINGAGKTMLMRAIIGLIRPTSGEVSVNGKIIGKEVEFLENVGFLLENPAFLDRYSGFDNLKMLASIQNKISDDQINDILKVVGLELAGKKKYRKYSLGMKQRLGIAAAVMEKPDVLILDEPTNALDEAGVEMINRVLCEEKERGALILISCHDIELLKMWSDEIIKLENGRVVQHIVGGKVSEGSE